ncbi:hypothetical protein LJR290_000987 [Variovorax sp. LjRoot290]|uniref:hypothetical protein n=1 Tax=unclassified Variovorax TaxID=663243 RepID=UPI003ECE176C
MKTSWVAVAGLATLVLCMTGCKGSGAPAAQPQDSNGNASASPSSSASADAGATRRQNDKTSEFLSAWRPKN